MRLLGGVARAGWRGRGHAAQFPMGARASTDRTSSGGSGSGSGLPPAYSPAGATAGAPAPALPDLTAATTTTTTTTTPVTTTGEDGFDSPPATPPAATQGGCGSQEGGISPGEACFGKAYGAFETVHHCGSAQHSTPHRMRRPSCSGSEKQVAAICSRSARPQVGRPLLLAPTMHVPASGCTRAPPGGGGGGRSRGGRSTCPGLPAAQHIHSSSARCAAHSLLIQVSRTEIPGAACGHAYVAGGMQGASRRR